MKNTLPLAALFALSASVGSAEILLSWDFAGATGSDLTNRADSASINVVNSGSSGLLQLGGASLQKSVGDSADAFIAGYSGNPDPQWSQALRDAVATPSAAMTYGSYISFFVEAAPGQSISLESFSINLALSNPESSISIYSSLTGFADADKLDILDSATDTVTSPAPGWQGGTTYTVDLTSETALQSIASATLVEFRVVNYAVTNGYMWWGASNRSGADLVINGTVASAIPEPASFAVIGGAFALAAVAVRRRRGSR